MSDFLTPPLGVVMPVYNGAQTLEATLSSIGSGENLEIVAVHQACDDHSREILEAAAQRLPLRVLDVAADSNWMRNTNIGLEALKAPVATILHQDDIWQSGRAEVALDLTRRFPEAHLWVQAAAFIDERGRRVGRFAPPFGPIGRLVSGEEALERLLVQNTIALPGAVFRRDTVLEQGGLNEALWYTADWDLWLRLAGQGPVGWDPDERVGFRLHAGSQTVKNSKDLEDFEAQLRIPFEAHISALSEDMQRGISEQSLASRRVNVFLAGRYHRAETPVGPVIRSILKLGPRGWLPFLRDTQVFQRILPRLRLLRRRSVSG